MVPTNVSAYGTIRAKCIQNGHIKSGYQGTTPTSLSIRASSNLSAAASISDFIEMKLSYAASASKLEFVDWQGGAVINPSTNPNVIIQGAKTLPDSLGGTPSDVATKKYVDDKTTDYIVVKAPVKVHNNTQLNTGSFNYDSNTPPGLGSMVVDASLFTNVIVGTSIDIDGVTVNLADRILFTNTTGVAPTGASSDGVYELVSVANTAGGIGFQRTSDMVVPLKKGTYVLVEQGATYSGYGYYLNNDVIDTLALQEWLLFSNTVAQEFAAPITQLNNGEYTVTSDINGSEEGALLVATFTGDAAQWQYDVGKNGEDFTILANEFTITENTAFINDTTIDALIEAPIITVNTPSNGSVEVQSSLQSVYYSNINRFASSVDGTPAIALTALNKTQVVTGGHITALTTGFDSASGTEDYGAGVFFNCINSDSNVGGTNPNQNRFAILPGKSADNLNCSINIVHWTAGGSGQTVATISPP